MEQKNVNKYRAETGVFINQQRNIETAFFIFRIIKASLEENSILTKISKKSTQSTPRLLNFTFLSLFPADHCHKTLISVSTLHNRITFVNLHFGGGSHSSDVI